jgi:hypothetical protein
MMKVAMVTIDCAQPRQLAQFWTAALGSTVTFDSEAYVMLAPVKDGSAAIGLQQVPEPKSGKTRIHLDLHSEDRLADVSRLVRLGAKELGEHSAFGVRWTALADPEGNEFCVSESFG